MATRLFRITFTDDWGSDHVPEATDVHHAITVAFPSLSKHGDAVRVEELARVDDEADLDFEVEAGKPEWLSAEGRAIQVPFVLGLARGVLVEGSAVLRPRSTGGGFAALWIDGQTMATLAGRADRQRILDEIDLVCEAAAGSGLEPPAAPPTTATDIQKEHRDLVHADGSECEDGCGGGL